MTTAQVREFLAAVRIATHRVNDIGLQFGPAFEGAEEYWSGFLASAATVLTRLDSEIEHELEERRKTEADARI